RCELQFEQLYWATGYTNPMDDPQLGAVNRAFQATGLDWSPTAFRSHSDGSLFHQKGSIPLICGPGRLEVAHTRHEHVSIRETCDAARLYAAIIDSVCID
ncbi:MAG: M20 family peptidase, partial [Gammaproteobacteria bacterium]